MLLVDDEPLVRQPLAEQLRDAGFAVTEAATAGAALAALDGTHDVLVTDLTMPGGMDGRALIRAAQARRPGLPAVLLTGYAGDEPGPDGQADAGGALYGAFSGFLGQGRMELLDPIGPDVWALPCWRALDHTPPGDWTLLFRRDGQGRVTEARVGCWLARGLSFVR